MIILLFIQILCLLGQAFLLFVIAKHLQLLREQLTQIGKSPDE